MKIKGLHPEHRHRRLIEALYLDRNKTRLLSIIVYGLGFLYLFWLLSGITLYRSDLRFIESHLIYIGMIIVPRLVSDIYVYYYSKKYSSEFISFWNRKLFFENKILYLLDLNNLNHSSNIVSRLSKCISS